MNLCHARDRSPQVQTNPSRSPFRRFIDSVHAFGLNASRALGAHPSSERPFRARENQHSYCLKEAPGRPIPGASLSAHPQGEGLTKRPLSRGRGTFVGPSGGCTGSHACSVPRSATLEHAGLTWEGAPPRSPHASPALRKQTVGRAPSLTLGLLPCPGAVRFHPSPRGEHSSAAPRPSNTDRGALHTTEGTNAWGEVPRV